MAQTSYGAKYDETLRTVDIAKRIRQDIKLAHQAGMLPAGLVTSVRSERFSGGSSITIAVVRMPEGMPVLNVDRLALDARNEHANGTPWASVEARRIQDALEFIMGQYNRDGSDPMTDYYDVKFYGRVEFDPALTIAERDAFNAQAVRS